MKDRAKYGGNWPEITLFNMAKQAANRIHPSQWAFWLHRFSGLALACYLPVHFLVLADQLSAGANDSATPWFESASIRVAHVVLCGLLGAHMVGGLRILAIQYAGMRRAQGLWLAVTLAFGFAVALMFALGLSANR